MHSLYHTLTITSIQEEVPGVKTFTFGGEDGNAITYQPGQYLTLVLQHQQREIRRSYSITSAPALGEPLTIGVKRIENGIFSRWLVERAEVGSQVITIGASGFFTLPPRPEDNGQVYFWAAGSGITPIYSMVKTLLYVHPRVAVVLVYSNHSLESALFREQLEALQTQFPERFELIFLYSNARRLDRARLHKDLLKELVRQTAKVPVSDILCYVCGPLNYRRLCHYGLREIEVPPSNIRQEIFYSAMRVAPAVPPDTQPHWVTLEYRDSTHRVPVQYPLTILQSARKVGVAMPFSCESGRCGNCAAQCLEGEVWMSYNEVLTDQQVARGLALTCVGYPVGGDVRLRMGP